MELPQDQADVRRINKHSAARIVATNLPSVTSQKERFQRLYNLADTEKESKPKEVKDGLLCIIKIIIGTRQ